METAIAAYQCGERELARFSIFQTCLLRLRLLAFQRHSCWPANPVTLVVYEV